jgi:probable HAF family extracellular repeat protein
VVNPFGANNRGEIIGNASFADEATSAPFRWSKGEFIDLGTFGGTFGEASSINDAGAIKGGLSVIACGCLNTPFAQNNRDLRDRKCHRKTRKVVCRAY